MKVLVIDDDDQVRNVIGEMLVSAGYVILEAADGVQGLEVLQSHPVDVVLTDILMPNKEGIETIRTIRRNHPGIKIIAMSGGGKGLDAHGLVRMAEMLGAHRALLKPFLRNELLTILHALSTPPVLPTQPACPSI